MTPMRPPRKQVQTGFTLIELMVVVSIVAILAGAGVPSFISMIKDNRLVTATNDLKVDLALARSESAKRGMRVTVCVSSNGSTCAGTDWKSGRIVFVDRNANGAVDADDEILRVNGSLPGQNKITSDFSNASYIQYRPSGLADSVGSFKLCDDRNGAFGRVIAINSVGRANLTTKVSCS